jgi:integrase
MAYIRKLPSGKWQATVRHPSGKRLTKTDALKKVVAEWAKGLEAGFDRGDMRDPRAGHITIGEWYARWIAARGVEVVTRDKLESAWRTHCAPMWATWPMDAVTHLEAQEWIRVLERKRRAKHRGLPGDDDSPVLAASTVHISAHLMSSLYRAAVNERPPIVVSNPFARLDLPEVPPMPIEYYEHDEAEALLEAAWKLRPDEPQWPALMELGMWVGLRPGEIFGLTGDRVDWLRWRIEVTQVMTRRGLREYPKTRKSHRTVPVPDGRLRILLPKLMEGRPLDALVFTRPQGGPIDDPGFRHRIWHPAVVAAGIRRFPPKSMRHTAASWLVQDGVPLYDVQALLGHESFTTTQRYAHLAPGTHDKVQESWRRTSDARGPKNEKGRRPA